MRPILRRALVLPALVFALIIGSAQPALAWGNRGVNRSGYGTHDWILDKAIKLVGEQASWVETATALAASDDPDTLGTNPYLHVFKQSGGARGGPQQAADEYAALLDAYQAGDYHEASRQLGVMSHYYADCTQPFHTYYYPIGSTRMTGYMGSRLIKDIHSDYEMAAWRGILAYGDELLVPEERQPITDIRAMAVSAAWFARGDYETLLLTFAETGEVNDEMPKLITSEVLSRSVNDLADIILAIPSGAGRSLAPAVFTQVMADSRYHFPRKGQLIGTQAACVDASGTPIEGVRVRFTWPAPDGTTKTYTQYSNYRGVASHWKVIESAGTMRKLPLTAKAVSSSQVAADSTWYMQTPILKAGSAGINTTLSTKSPTRGTRVRARVKVVSLSGKPVAGLPVTFRWYHKSGTIEIRAVTNSKGIARCSRNIGSSKRGYRVWVKASVISGGKRRASRLSFIPR